MLLHADSESEKVCILKSMGNACSKSLIPTIRTVLDDEKEPEIIRLQAIYALRKLAKVFNKQVL